MGKKEEQEATMQDETEDSSTEAEKDGTEEGDEEILSWGFEFSEKKEEKETSAKDETDEDEDEPSDVDVLKNEVKALKTQARMRKELDKLSKKYNGKEGFPDVDEAKIIGFLEKDFENISPMELGYIFSGFNDILKAQKELGRKVAKDKYSPEALDTSKKEEYVKKMNNNFLDVKERFKRKFLKNNKNK